MKKLSFLLILISFLFRYPLTANAGVISYVTGLFSSEKQKASEDVVFYANSQAASFLSAPIFNNSSLKEENISTIDNPAIFPISGPAGTLADVEYLNTANSKIKTYTVREGDNLGKIAKMFGVTTNTIAWANDIRGGLVKPGQTLLILPISGVKHKIKSGDTLSKIANEYGGNVDDILRYNNISENAKLVLGEEIIVPAGKIKSAPIVATKPSQITTQRVSGYYVPASVFNTNLKFGMRGQSVIELEDLLISENCLNYQPTGYFGLITLSAVQCFQSKYNIPPTGYFGIMSRTKANEIVLNLISRSIQAEKDEKKY